MRVNRGEFPEPANLDPNPAQSTPRAFGVNKFSRIENSVGIDNLFELAMQLTRDLARRLGPPAFLRQTDPVFARNHAAPGEHLRKKFIQSALHFLAHGRVTIETISHDVDVNVSIAGVTETGDRKSMFCLKLACEFH